MRLNRRRHTNLLGRQPSYTAGVALPHQGLDLGGAKLLSRAETHPQVDTELT